jgi:predicted nucleotidyltransferase
MELKDTIPVSDLARQTRAVVERLVADPAARFVVMRNNRPVAVIAGVASEPPAPGGARADVLRKRGLIRTLAGAHGARTVSLFGSAARGEERPESDLDFLVDLEPGRSLVDLIALEKDLADALGRKVDVVTARSVKPRVLKEALRDAVRIV